MPKDFVIVSTRQATQVGLRTWLSQFAPEAVINVVQAGRDAIALVDDIGPTVIVVDDPMPDMLARDVWTRARLRQPGVQLILVGDTGVPALRLNIEAGIHGFVSAMSGPDVLTSAVAHVTAGRTYVDPIIAGDLIMGDEIGPSPRELEVLDLLVDGHQNKVIAHMLDISNETVKTHVSTLMRKMGASCRTELAVRAIQHAYVRLPAPA